MRSVSTISHSELTARLMGEGIALKVGPYVYRISTDLPSVISGIATLYSDFPVVPADSYVDFSIALRCRRLAHRIRGRAEFLFDDQSPFDSIPVGQAYAFLEWGMNWCISLHCNEYLSLHAAVVARDSHAIVLPGVPGAGKSTLCAALGLSDWQILSDEHALITMDSSRVVPLCRPVSLKNASIDAIRSFAAQAVFGPVSKETHKGVVAHMRADMHPDSHNSEPLPVHSLVFPRYATNEPQRLLRRSRTESFIIAAYHSFNYSLLGETGFDALRRLVDNTACYDLTYHDLDWAIAAMNDISTGEPTQ